MNSEISRREFLLAAASAAGVVLIAGCASDGSASDNGTQNGQANGSVETEPWTTAPTGEGASSPVTASRNPDGTLRVRGGGKLRPGTAIAFTMAPDDNPGIVCVTQQGELYALSAKCTHAGCTVVWQHAGNEARLHCPCHLSNFDMNGRPLNGPATLPLERYTARIEGNDAIITLARNGNLGRKAEVKG